MVRNYYSREKDKLMIMVNCRALTSIKRRRSALISRTDEMFDRTGNTKVYSKINLKIMFRRFRMKSEDN